ncbi:hypothetical protein [Novosphingobium olei]|uniref:Uncharacterized protein n=1 Tax=Novosphingobium olei TaxID=2728851 RepID=A0A7Y0BKN3_9SPHN|nr:hypothetical protein [Novosphingobium olei]NML92231.1 hypothetical protein [Novosphingobium olei]
MNTRHGTRARTALLAGALLHATLGLAGPAAAQTPPPDVVDPAPTAADWAALGKLPDWSGTWLPDISDQVRQITTNPVPWKAAVQAQVDFWTSEEKEGRPRGLLLDCLPHGMPSLILITHNANEFLFSPGRVTLLGESDGNRLRRIWTDGRKLPDDPDPTFHGTSVGHWEGDTLVVETRGILPQVYLAISEAVGIPLGEGAAVHERIHLIDPDTLVHDLVIEAPQILTRPWETRRIFHRNRKRSYEIVEGVCRQGDFEEGTDKWGNRTYVPTHQQDGNILPPPTK